MIRMRLRLIARANFQHSDADNYLAAMRQNPGLRLGPDDVIALFARSENQMAFIWKPVELNLEKMTGAGARRGTATAFKSVRVRLTRSSWNELMIADYAADNGIDLEGLKTFKEMMELKEEKKRRGASNVVPLRKAA